VALRPGGLPNDSGWTIQRAEDLLGSLNGVVSVRVVVCPGGDLEEIHLLTTTDVHPKQTVRNVESALKAHFHLEVDHRIISVAQSNEAVVGEKPPAENPVPGPMLMELPVEPMTDARILFLGHQIQTGRARRVKVAVSVEWRGSEFTGEAVGADLARSRQETVAKATLAAIEKAMEADEEDTRQQSVTLALDGVKTVEAFDRSYVLVEVNAIHQRDVADLSGASAVEDTPERAVILATLQATDRWVRGRF
jgi:hypothetical protein